MTNTDIASATSIMLGTTQASAMYIGNTLMWSNNPTPSANFLDVLYSDANGNLSIDSQVLPASEGKIPIGLCIAPTGFFGANEPARWMSLKYMNYNTPDSGSLSGQLIYYGNYQNDITSITNIQIAYVNGSNNGYLSDISTNAPQIPSLFDANDDWNLSELGTVNDYAVTDIDGKVKTNKMLETATAQANWRTDSTITLDYRSNYAPSACCCWRYHPLGTEQGDWYLGSCGEISMMIAKKTNINTKLAAINAIYPNDCISSLAVQWYLTSTKYSTACPWMLSSYNGRVKRNENESYYVLALLQY